jgi:hypothetical protein
MRHPKHAWIRSWQSLSDLHARCGQLPASVESSPCLETTTPPLEAYQLMLRRAFLTTDLPRRITLDHGTVFDENTSPSPFPTRLHLWLLADGASTSASPASAVPPTTPRLSALTRP